MNIIVVWFLRSLPRLRLVVVVASLATGFSHGAWAQGYAVQVRTGIAYGPKPEEQGDLYAPVQPMGPLPTILMIHGGGWIEGSRHADNAFAKLVAGMGAVVFNIDYRLAKEAEPETRWPAQLVDAQLAVRFLRAHAEALGVDPARVGAMGDSAGAQLALLLGALHKIVPGDEAGLYPGQRTDVKAVVDQFGPTDLAALGAGASHNNAALFGTPSPSSNLLQAASPISLMGAQVAPIYILHGTADKVIPFEQSRRLVEVLRAKGIKPVIVPFDGGHAYDGIPIPEVVRMLVDATHWMLLTLDR